MLFFDPARNLRTELQDRETIRRAVLRTRRRWIFGTGATALAFLTALVGFSLFGTGIEIQVLAPLAVVLTIGSGASTIFFLNCLIGYQTVSSEMELERGDDELELRFKEAGAEVKRGVYPWKH